MTENTPIISLPALKLNPTQYRYTSASFRPIRKGGIRYQSEKIGDKLVFHNYGQGGGGYQSYYLEFHCPTACPNLSHSL